MTALLDRLFSLGGKVAVVTGASRGIGAAIAAGLADAGASVTATARSEAPRVNLGAAAYRACDATETTVFERLLAEVAAPSGGLDILVNAAGITIPTTRSGDQLAAFDRTLETNLRAAYAACMAAAAHMRPRGGGSIINVTSIASVLGFADNPAYVASKGGLRQLTKALAIDLGPEGIRVNNLAPGYVRTAMTEASYADPDLNAQRLRHTILGRWGEPEDLVGAALFLASDASAYVTGIDLFVDGGWTAKGMV